MSRPWHNQPPILHRLVRTQARLTPDRIAAVYEDHWITYGELVDRSGGWAHRLRGLGVGVGTLVGLCLERSGDLPVLVMAVLEAGGVCVPLEPSDPPPRIGTMIREAGPALVLTQRRLRPGLPSTDVPIIEVDGWAPGAAAAPEAPVSGDDLAFILMTSGSTGVPKGVMVSHAAASARMFRSEDDLTAEGRCMAIVKTPIGNGPFLGEIFAPMLHGCYFAVARPDGHRDMPYLIGLMIEHRLSHIAMTSAMLRAFLECPDCARCVDLEAIYCGGEAVTDDLRARCEERLVGARFVVTYGATEAGHSLSRECPAGDRLDGTRVGRAIPGARVHLLETDLEPTPAGEVGEMYLGGARLAAGYLDRPAATAERFVPHPAPGVPGERLYRSGDLGRLMPDGELEFKGRVDQLVKIGGNRVELLEIEAALSACPGVRQAVVLARPNGRGEAHLVAYITPEGAPGPSARELRTRLAERLPAFMVPPVFVALDAMPMTPNGKVDRRALPAPVEDRGAAGVAYAAPRSTIEHRLAALWAELLGLEQVGIHDDFLALGGDSLLLIRLLGRVEAEFGRRIGLESIFREVTVEQVARVLGEEPRGRPGGRADPARPAGSKPPLFCLDDYGILLARSLGLDQPVHWLDQDMPFHESMTIEDLARYRVEGLRAIRPEGPYFLLGYSAGGVIAFEMAHQLLAQGQAVALLALLDSPGPSPHRVGRIRLQAHRFSRRIRRLMRGDLGAMASRLSSRFRSMTARISRRIGLDSRPSVERAPDVYHADLPYVKYLGAAIRRYSPRPLDCRVALFVARDSDDRWLDERRISTWEALAASGLELHRVPGDHTTFMKGHNLQALAREFLECLHRAQRG